MEWSLHGDGVRSRTREWVVNRPSWHPGYFHPTSFVVDSPFRNLLRSISDQTPSPTCIKELFDESASNMEDDPLMISNNSSASSSPHLSRLSHSSCVSDSSVPSSDASASGDKLKKRRKYMKKRSIKRRNTSQSLKVPQEGCSGKAESPSAVYCEEWIFSTANHPDLSKRLTFAAMSDFKQIKVPDSLELRRNSLENDLSKSPKKNKSWLNIWQNILRINPKPKNKPEDPINIEIHPMVARVSALPSISEGGLSETHSTLSVTHCSVAPSSASGSVTACNAQSNTTNHKVCFMVVVIPFRSLSLNFNPVCGFHSS